MPARTLGASLRSGEESCWKKPKHQNPQFLPRHKSPQSAGTPAGKVVTILSHQAHKLMSNFPAMVETPSEAPRPRFVKKRVNIRRRSLCILLRLFCPCWPFGLKCGGNMQAAAGFPADRLAAAHPGLNCKPGKCKH